MVYVFDLDGTLIDSKERHWVLLYDLLRERNIDPSPVQKDDYWKQKLNGVNTFNILRTIFHFSDRESDDIASQWIKHIEDERYLLYDKIYDDVNPFFELLGNDARIIFLTARRNKSGLMDELKRLDLFSRAHRVFAADPFRAEEEKDKIVKYFLPQNPVIIGDTETEYNIAVNNGVSHFILNRGFRSEDYMKKRNIKNYSSLLEMELYL